MIKNNLLALLFFATLAFGESLQAQELHFNIKSQENPTQKDYLPAAFHKVRRDSLRNIMPDSSVAFIFASPVRNRSNDVDFQYHQNPNLYYLSGVNEPDVVLVIFKETHRFDSISANELLFVRRQDKKKAVWVGMSLGTKEAAEISAVKAVLDNESFADLTINYDAIKKVFVDKNKLDYSDNPDDRGDLHSMSRHFDARMEKLNKEADAFGFKFLMSRLRETKEPEELELMKKAINMTCLAHIELMKALTPGMNEFQAQAIVEYIFKKNGSEYPGYPSIVGGGENSCVLHYTKNRKQLNPSEMLVVDMGAEYHGYTADVTRTLPVDGIFSPEEKAIYNLVYQAQTAGINACLAGKKFWQAHDEATKIIRQGLLDHGIIKRGPDYVKYFMHGTSHYLGLDVHDLGTNGRLKPGTIITVEPGIYIPAGSDCDKKWWNIGVRIEDDILITDGKPVNLSESIPRKAEEVEQLMKLESLFNKIK